VPGGGTGVGLGDASDAKPVAAGGVEVQLDGEKTPMLLRYSATK
jgi:hypothetical protein